MLDKVDLWGQLSKLMDRYRYSMIGLTLAMLIVAIPLGCQAQAKSPFDGQKVNEAALLSQAEAYAAHLEAKLAAVGNDYKASAIALDADYKARTAALSSKYANETLELDADGKAKATATQAALAEIAAQKELVQKSIESVQMVANQTAPGYGSLIASAVGVAGLALGFGSAADSARKDKVIAKLKNVGESTDAPTAKPPGSTPIATNASATA